MDGRELIDLGEEEKWSRVSDYSSSASPWVVALHYNDKKKKERKVF